MTRIVTVVRKIIIGAAAAGLLLGPLAALADTDWLQFSYINISRSKTSATISWYTTQPTTGLVRYGTTTAYNAQVNSTATNAYQHSVTLNNLHSGTEYHFQVYAKSTDHELWSADQKFKTTGTVSGYDYFDMIEGEVAYVTSRIAVIQWETTDLGTTIVRYGIDPNKLTGTASARGTRLKHDVTLSRLKPDTDYYFLAESKSVDDVVVQSPIGSFTTLPNDTEDKRKFELLNVQAAHRNASGVFDGSILVTWDSNKPANGIVYYGTSEKRMSSKVIEDAVRRGEHEVVISGLKQNTTYFVRVQSTDVFGKTVSSNIYRISPNTELITKWDGRAIGVGGENPDEPVKVGGITHDAYSKADALVKVRGTNQIYAIFKGEKYLLPGPTALRRYGAGRSVKEITQAQLNTYPHIKLVKSADHGTVYYVAHRSLQKTLRLPIPNASVFASYPANRWDRIVILDESDVQRMRLATVVGNVDTGDVYLIQNGLKRPIASPDAFYRLGFEDDDIVGVNTAHVNAYQNGEIIE